MSTRPPALETTDDVIRAIGSTELRKITGASSKTVWNWKQSGRGRFPARTHMAITGKLQALGLSARRNLWSGLDSIPDEPRGLINTGIPEVISPAGA